MTIQGLDFISRLPSEIALKILEHLSEHPVWLCRMQQVSSHWHKLASDDAPWRTCCLHWGYAAGSFPLKATFRREFTTLRKWHTTGSEKNLSWHEIGDGMVTAHILNAFYCVVGLSGGIILVFETGSGRILRTLTGHTSGVWTLSFASSAHLLLSAGSDRAVRVWDLQTGRCLHILDGHRSTVRAVVSFPGTPFAVTASRDNTLRSWDVSTGSPLDVKELHDDSVRCLDYTKQSNGIKLASGGYDKTIRVSSFDSHTGEITLLHTLRGHLHQVFAVVFSPDGDLIASTGLDSGIRIWDTSTGNCLVLLQGHVSSVNRLQAITPRPKVLQHPFSSRAPGADAVVVSGGWLLVSGSVSGRVVTYAVEPINPTTAPEYSPFFPSPPDRSTFESPSPPKYTFKPLYTIEAHETSISSLHADGDILVTSGLDRKVRVFDVRTGSGGRETRASEANVHPWSIYRRRTTARLTAATSFNVMEICRTAFLSSPSASLGQVGRRRTTQFDENDTEKSPDAGGGILTVITSRGDAYFIDFWSMRDDE